MYRSSQRVKWNTGGSSPLRRVRNVELCRFAFVSRTVNSRYGKMHPVEHARNPVVNVSGYRQQGRDKVFGVVCIYGKFLGGIDVVTYSSL